MTVLAPEGDGTFELAPGEEAKLLAAMADADRGETTSVADILQQIRRSLAIRFLLSSLQGIGLPLYNIMDGVDSTKYIYWQDNGQWLGYLHDHPDYWTQGGVPRRPTVQSSRSVPRPHQR